MVSSSQSRPSPPPNDAFASFRARARRLCKKCLTRNSASSASSSLPPLLRTRVRALLPLIRLFLTLLALLGGVRARGEKVDGRSAPAILPGRGAVCGKHLPHATTWPIFGQQASVRGTVWSGSNAAMCVAQSRHGESASLPLLVDSRELPIAPPPPRAHGSAARSQACFCPHIYIATAEAACLRPCQWGQSHETAATAPLLVA